MYLYVTVCTCTGMSIGCRLRCIYNNVDTVIEVNSDNARKWHLVALALTSPFHIPPRLILSDEWGCSDVVLLMFRRRPEWSCFTVVQSNWVVKFRFLLSEFLVSIKHELIILIVIYWSLACRWQHTQVHHSELLKGSYEFCLKLKRLAIG